MNWSSGKDAALAYHLLTLDPQYKVTRLLTTVSLEHERVFMHGIRENLLEIQAERMNLPLSKVKLPASPDDTIYKGAMMEIMTQLQKEGITMAAYGDIFLEDLRQYRDQQLARVGLEAIFPLWKKDTGELVKLVEESGIEAIIVCVNDRCLGREFLGKKINAALLQQLPPGVDPCGENGEYHTFVTNAPFFKSPIEVKTGEIVYKQYVSENKDRAWDTGFYFLDCYV